MTNMTAAIFSDDVCGGSRCPTVFFLVLLHQIRSPQILHSLLPSQVAGMCSEPAMGLLQNRVALFCNNDLSLRPHGWKNHHLSTIPATKTTLRETWVWFFSESLLCIAVRLYRQQRPLSASALHRQIGPYLLFSVLRTWRLRNPLYFGRAAPFWCCGDPCH